MLKLVDEAEQVLVDETRNLDEFGYLLDETWKLKKGTGSVISTDGIDLLYQNGLKAGAIGGKLLGAGGGGFLVFYVPLKYQAAVHEAMKDLLYIPFEFENDGTQIIHFTKENYDCQWRVE